MTESCASAPQVAQERIGVRAVARLAWPAVLSYLLANAYRIGDQFWIQGLGPAAQTAVGGTVFVVIMNFAVVFLAAGGTLALVARAVGARDEARRDGLIVSAMLLATIVWAVLATLGPRCTPGIVAFLGLEQAAATHAQLYLETLYLVSLPLVLAPALDHALIGMGNTLVMSAMECVAVLLHLCLAPALIYGAEGATFAEAAPIAATAGLAARLAEALGIQAQGVAGAAWSAAIARTVSVVLCLFVMGRRHGVDLSRGWREARASGGRWLHMVGISRISLPMSLSIATYASVYWALIKWVVVPVGDDALAALGIGFAAFEGVSFPLYLGVSMAGASLVGRALGAGRPQDALDAIAGVRKLALALGLTTTCVFLWIAERGCDVFSADPSVQRAIAGYVSALACSQVFVALESAHEKALLGAGYTRPALGVSLIGNGVRIPLAWWLAIDQGHGAHGVWWALNATSFLKASLQYTLVQRRGWLSHAPAIAPPLRR